jgi:hypothetical protein
MSDDGTVEKFGEQDEPQDEIEAHSKNKRIAANDEPAQEGEGDDEVEAHRRRVAAPDADKLA